MANPPKPTALKVIEGNRGKRSTGKQEPDPEYLEDLGAPGWLNPSARAVWEEVAPHLAKAKLLTKVDVQLLAMGCVSIAQYRQAVSKCCDDLVKVKRVQDVALDGGASDDPVNVNPWLIVQSMSFKQAMAVFREFGMSPAARTRIAVQPQLDLFDGQKKGSSNNYFS